MNNMTKKIGVQKGTKRGPYKRAAQKREGTLGDGFNTSGMSYAEIAKVLNITPAEVEKIEQSALKKLKIKTEANQKLFEYTRDFNWNRVKLC